MPRKSHRDRNVVARAVCHHRPRVNFPVTMHTTCVCECLCLWVFVCLLDLWRLRVLPLAPYCLSLFFVYLVVLLLRECGSKRAYYNHFLFSRVHFARCAPFSPSSRVVFSIVIPLLLYFWRSNFGFVFRPQFPWEDLGARLYGRETLKGMTNTFLFFPFSFFFLRGGVPKWRQYE